MVRYHFSPRPVEDDSIAVLLEDGQVLHKSDAVIGCMKLLGGVWLLAGVALALVPKFVRDKGYDTVGRWLYHFAGRLDTAACPILPAPLSKKFLG